MVKHIVMWKLRECATEGEKRENAEQIKRILEALQGQITGLLRIQVIIDPFETSNADVTLYSEFENRAALEGYVVHPAHKQAGMFVRSVVETKTTCDYEDWM